MALTTLLFLIALGFAVLMVELFLTPGATFFGIIGVILMLAGIVMTYASHGAMTGNITLVVTFVSSIIATILAFRKFESGEFGLKEELDGRVNELTDLDVDVLDRGKAIGDLKPHGRALFSEKVYNVDSRGEFIDEGTPIEIVQITDQKIFVRAIK